MRGAFPSNSFSLLGVAGELKFPRTQQILDPGSLPGVHRKRRRLVTFFGFLVRQSIIAKGIRMAGSIGLTILDPKEGKPLTGLSYSRRFVSDLHGFAECKNRRATKTTSSYAVLPMDFFHLGAHDVHHELFA